MENISLKTIALSNGETYAYREKGTGSKVLILLHGNTSSSLFFDELIERMPENEYHIIAPDMRGFGETTYNTPITKMKDLATDLKLLVDALKLNKFALLGWSAGGPVAMEFAIENPNYVSHLILMASGSIKGYPILKNNFFGKPIPGEFISTREEMAKLMKPAVEAYTNKKATLVKMIFNKSFFIIKKPETQRFEAYIQEVYKQRNLIDLNMGLITFNISHEHNGVVEGSGEVDKIVTPTLIIHGDKDNVVTKHMLEENVKGFGEKAKLVMLNNCGHAVVTDCPDQLAQEIKVFIG